MLERHEVKAAIEDLFSAAMFGVEWEAALDRFAKAAEAGGAALVRVRDGNAVGWLASQGFAEADAWSDRTPVSSRRLFPEKGFSRGFHTDQEFFSAAELAGDPYYQDFLKPRGVFWHAKAKLGDGAPGERFTLTLKRHLQLGPYEPQDVAVLNSVFEDFEALVRIARGVLDSETRGVIQAIHRGDRTVFEIDKQGRVLRQRRGARDLKTVRVVGGRLVTIDRLVQRSIDRAVAAALTAPTRTAVVIIPDQGEGPKYLQFIPLPAAARDVFQAAKAIAVVIDPRRELGKGSPNLRAICKAYGLTPREVQIVELLTTGISLGEVASHMSVKEGTARNHLKSILSKTGTGRQGELIALIANFL